MLQNNYLVDPQGTDETGMRQGGWEVNEDIIIVYREMMKT